MQKTLLSSLVFFPALAMAAGPLNLEGLNGNTPVKYEDPNVGLNLDIGTLGAKTNASADLLFLEAIDLWNSVATATISLSQGNDLAVDVDITNYTDYIPAGFDDNNFEDGDGLNPIIYDDDGSIIDAFFGTGQSDLIAGFATSGYNAGGNYYLEGYAVLNGKMTTVAAPSLDDVQLTLLVAHEIGHFIGLDHTVLDYEEGASTSCTTLDQSLYPLMYPFVCRYEKTLHDDDVISVSSLYPEVNLNEQYGQINGHFTQVSGNAILGTNIYARNTGTNRVYGSVISDYLKQGTGFFSLYLPPGSYTLHANSLNTELTGGSGVGPYATDLNDASFQAPNPIAAVSFEGSTAGSDEVLTVTAGEAVEVEFKLDGSGTFTTGNEIFTPAIETPPADGGGSGSFTPGMLFMMVIAGGLRLMRRRHH